MTFARTVVVVVVLGSLSLSMGCTTVMKPVRPSTPVGAEGPPLAGVRFDGEETRIREPGVPVSPSRQWQREVANYTATSLNRALSTPEMAPSATTTASFDLAEPPAFSFGPTKRMTIALTSSLPDGSVVRSTPVVGDLDTFAETAVISGLGIGGTVLDVLSLVAVLYFVATPSNPMGGAVLLGSLALGLGLNIAQGAAEQIVASSQEARWSDLYAAALRQHAVDVRSGIGRGPPPGAPPPPTTSSDPSDVLAPPPFIAPTPSPSPSPSPSPPPPR